MWPSVMDGSSGRLVVHAAGGQVWVLRIVRLKELAMCPGMVLFAPPCLCKSGICPHCVQDGRRMHWNMRGMGSTNVMPTTVISICLGRREYAKPEETFEPSPLVAKEEACVTVRPWPLLVVHV